MTIRKTKQAAEGGHWYSREEDGSARQVVDLVGKNGKRRKPTLRDARAHGWVPGVTSILRAAGSPEPIVRWRIQQAVLAALTLPRMDGESEQDWLARVDDDMGETARSAAEAGSRIHASLEAHFRGELADTEDWGRIASVIRLFRDAGIDEALSPWQAERAVVHELGFGTRSDLHSDTWCVDWKTKDGDLPTQLYPDHWAQLAATRRALEYTCGYPAGSQRCAIVYISRETDEARMIEASEAELARGWDMFASLHKYWTAKTLHMPGWTLGATEAMREHETDD